MTTWPNPLGYVRVRFHATFVGDDFTIPEGAEGVVAEESEDRVTVELITPVDGRCLVTWKTEETPVFATSLARQHIEEVRRKLYRLTMAVTYEVDIHAPSVEAIGRWLHHQSDPIARMKENPLDIQSIKGVHHPPKSAVPVGLSVNEQGEESRGLPLRWYRGSDG